MTGHQRTILEFMAKQEPKPVYIFIGSRHTQFSKDPQNVDYPIIQTNMTTRWALLKRGYIQPVAGHSCLYCRNPHFNR